MATSARRRRWLWLGLLPALVLLGVFGVRALLEPERLSAFLLREASQATGLQLALAQPAEVGFWPDLHLEFEGLTATAPGASTPLLRVGQMDAVLPWTAVTADAIEIRSLRLGRPELDWPRLQAWLATRAKAAAPMTLPRIDAAVDVSDGRVAAKGWSVDGVSLHLPSLRAGTATSLDIAGTVRVDAGETRAPTAVEPRSMPFAARITFTPRQSADGLRLDEVAVAMTTPQAITLRGALAFAGGDTSIALAGELAAWPAEWPALPLPADDPAAPVRIEFDYRNDTVTANLARGDAAIDLALQPGDLAAWRNDPAAPLLPPLTGRAAAERLQFGGIELRGVELRVEDDDAQP